MGGEISDYRVSALPSLTIWESLWINIPSGVLTLEHCLPAVTLHEEDISESAPSITCGLFLNGLLPVAESVFLISLPSYFQPELPFCHSLVPFETYDFLLADPEL